MRLQWPPPEKHKTHSIVMSQAHPYQKILAHFHAKLNTG
jgi:hypothetical protein